jgi:LacI family transcriptional regulator
MQPVAQPVAQMGEDRPTIADVARRAGVSKTTVSHVVNGTRIISAATRQRVDEAIAQLQYHPSVAAQSLTTKRSGTIGVIISDASNLFFGELLRGLEDVFGRARRGLVVCNTDETLEREPLYVDLLLRLQVDGIIAAACSRGSEALDRARSYRVPIVFVDRRFRGMPGPFVGADNAAGARMAVEHLIESGHRRIGLVAGFQRLSTMRERTAGYRQALEHARIDMTPDLVAACPLNIEAGREAVRRLLALPDRPTALFLNNNLLSLGALLALRDLGLRCPDDVALAGFDDHPWSEVSRPALTVVTQPATDIGRRAAELLSEMMLSRSTEESSVLLPCALTLRESCCRHHPGS